MSALVTSAARGIQQELNPEIPTRFRTFSQIYSASLGSRRLNLVLIGFFGIAALLLATAGMFDVGVALGAGSSDVLRMSLGQGLPTILAIELGGSLALARTVESLLFGVTANDPLTFAGVIALVGAAALLACYIPARRSTRVDPLVVYVMI